MRRVLLALLVVAILVSPGSSSWGTGGCGPVGSFAFGQDPFAFANRAPVNRDAFWWYHWEDDDSQVALMLGVKDGRDRQLGVFNFEKGTYRPRQGEGFGSPTLSPMQPPERKESKRGKEAKKAQGDRNDARSAARDEMLLPAADREAPNFGILRNSGGFSQTERYAVNGADTDKDTARRLIEADPALPQDGNWPWLVYVGKSKDDCKKAGAVLSSFTKKFRLQCYLNGEWYTKDKAGKVVYQDGLTVASDKGKQLVHWDTAEEGFKVLSQLPADWSLDQLAELLERLLKKPAPPLLPDLSSIPTHVWVLLGLAVVYLLKRQP